MASKPTIEQSRRNKSKDFEAGSGQHTPPGDAEPEDGRVSVLCADSSSKSFELKASLKKEEEEGKEGEVVKERDSKRGREWRQEAMLKEQSKKWKRRLSENDQGMEKTSERDREWEQQLEEKQHEWEERMQTWQKKRDTELQEKRKEIQQLKNKIKELEKAADMLGKVQRHSKGQSQQLMQLQDEAMARDNEAGAMRRSMEGMQDQLEKLQIQNQELAKERGQLRQENKRFQRQVAKPKEFTKEHGQWKEARLRLEGQVSKLQADILLQTQEKERAQNELHSIITQCNDLKKENLSFREELKKISSLHHENQQLYVQVNELTQATEDLSKERDALRITLQTTEAQVAVFKEDFDAERSDRERAHALRNEEGERYKEKISRLQSELDHTRQQLESHKGNLSGLEDMHQRRQKELMHALEQLKAAQEEVQAKTSQVKQYKKQNDQATAELASSKAENKELMDHVEAFRQEIERRSIGEKRVLKTKPKAMTKHSKKEVQNEHLQQELMSQATLVQANRQKPKERKAKIAELEVENSGLKQEMKQVRREAERTSEKLVVKEKEKKKKTTSICDISNTSPVSETDMSTQIELAEIKEENRKLRDDNDTLECVGRAGTIKDLQPITAVLKAGHSMETPFPHADEYMNDSSQDVLQFATLEESQITAGVGHFQERNCDIHVVPYGLPQGQPTPAHSHNDNVQSMARVAVEAPQHYSQQDGCSQMPQREQLQTDEQHVHHANQSRVQTVIEESKKCKHQHQEVPQSAPMPGELQFNCPPPMISHSEEVRNKSHSPTAAMNQRDPPHEQDYVKQGGIQHSMQGGVKDVYGGSGHGRKWDGPIEARGHNNELVATERRDMLPAPHSPSTTLQQESASDVTGASSIHDRDRSIQIELAEVQEKLRKAQDDVQTLEAKIEELTKRLPREADATSSTYVTTQDTYEVTHYPVCDDDGMKG